MITQFASIFSLIVFASGIIVSSLDIVNRETWGARFPKRVEYINKTAPYVIIHHSYQPAACFTQEKCSEAMRSMQRFHQDERGWNDIGYTFAIGGDGRVYQGRGFNVVGAHAPKYNDKSIGICLIGDWQSEVPPKKMLEATQNLIGYAIDTGNLLSNYTLLGHCQVRDTICPGPALFHEIEKWPHFDSSLPCTSNEL